MINQGIVKPIDIRVSSAKSGVELIFPKLACEYVAVFRSLFRELCVEKKTPCKIRFIK